MDGAIQPVGLAAKVLDSQGTAVLPASITLSAVTGNPVGSNAYFVTVQFGTNVPPGDYRIVWTGTYTTKAGAGPLNIYLSKSFKMTSNAPPSKFFFWDTQKAS